MHPKVLQMNTKLCSRQFEGRDRAGGRTLQRTGRQAGDRRQSWADHRETDNTISAEIAKIRHRNIMDTFEAWSDPGSGEWGGELWAGDGWTPRRSRSCSGRTGWATSPSGERRRTSPPLTRATGQQMMKISKLDDKRGSGTGRVQLTCLRHYIQRPRTLNLQIFLVMRVSVSCLRASHKSCS